MITVTLTNSLGRKKEVITPRLGNDVSLYVCGITPYDYAHIGHGRCYVTFDILVRLLTFLQYHVTYVRNVTDIDDKLLHKAAQQGNQLTYSEIARTFEAAFDTDMEALNCLDPQFEPRVTDHIPEIIALIETLISRGHAYVVGHDVYFNVMTDKTYGKLSGRCCEDLKAGARIQVREEKCNPEDFALWKGNDEKLFWQSPWGYGRPGWHIECSAMARAILGDTIDIHGGGMDLIFPHHENEIAQSECASGKPFARYWVHNAFVTIKEEKMSKSLGNFFTLRDVFAQFNPMVVRFYYLQHQYRNPIDFSFEGLEAAEKAYRRLVHTFATIQAHPMLSANDVLDKNIVNQMTSALCDDLNTPKVLGLLFECLDDIKHDNPEARRVKWFLQNVLGLTLAPLPEKSVEYTPEIIALLEARTQARAQKDWKKADELRAKLEALGVPIQDKKT